MEWKEGALGARGHRWEQRVLCGAWWFLIMAQQGCGEDRQKAAKGVTWRGSVCCLLREVWRCGMVRLISVSLASRQGRQEQQLLTHSSWFCASGKSHCLQEIL